MKRSDAIYEISKKLQKSKNLFDGYKNGNLDLKCLCDNLSLRILRFCEDELMMGKPPRFISCDNYQKEYSYFDWSILSDCSIIKENGVYGTYECSWEPEELDEDDCEDIGFGRPGPSEY